MKKITLTLIAFATMITAACSSDDGNPTNPVNTSKNEIIDWESGNATDYGLRLSSDELDLYENLSFENLEFRIKITPKPGFENVPYKIYAQSYFPNTTKIYEQNATGEITGDFVSIPDHGLFTFHIYMENEMEYDAELLLKSEGFGGNIEEKTALGQERQD